MKQKGMLISFEGGEGCGKSTQLAMFKEYLERRNIPYLVTREPGGTDVGEEIRKILLDPSHKMSARTEFLLFSASRSKIVQDVIKPALAEGKVVILDRYFDSSFVYQGFAGGVDLCDIAKITEVAIGEDLKMKADPTSAVPKLTVYLDLAPEVGFGRKAKDANLQNLDRIEQNGLDFHRKVRTGYLKLAEAFPERICVVDASQSREEVLADVCKLFEQRYEKFAGKLPGRSRNVEQ